MQRRKPQLVKSALSGLVTRDGITVGVCIIRVQESTRWSLKVVNSAGTTIEWNNGFASDDAAMEEFLRTVGEEGISVFLDREKVASFHR